MLKGRMMQVNVGYEPGRDGEPTKPKTGFNNKGKNHRAAYPGNDIP